jgi:hypothetical protein
VTSVVVRLSLDFYGKMVFASCVVFTSDLSFSLVSFVRKEVSSLLFFPISQIDTFALQIFVS